VRWSPPSAPRATRCCTFRPGARIASAIAKHRARPTRATPWRSPMSFAASTQSSAPRWSPNWSARSPCSSCSAAVSFVTAPRPFNGCAPTGRSSVPSVRPRSSGSTARPFCAGSSGSASARRSPSRSPGPASASSRATSRTSTSASRHSIASRATSGASRARPRSRASAAPHRSPAAPDRPQAPPRRQPPAQRRALPHRHRPKTPPPRRQGVPRPKDPRRQDTPRRRIEHLIGTIHGGWAYGARSTATAQNAPPP
jgi:hypothetical protein